MKYFSASSVPGGMAESVDAVDLKSADRKVVGVQVSLPPLRLMPYGESFALTTYFIVLVSNK
ncbi:MAG: hypothetical protein RLZZ381_2821 [Cyanobacteriota bacterium]